jgi:hypothetical protein
MSYGCRIGLAFALGLALMAGCSDENGEGVGGAGGMAGTGGVSGMGGEGGSGGIAGQVFPCSEQGIRDAIAEGGGPHAFECSGRTVVTKATIFIDNDVILDGEGKLILSGASHHRVFIVPRGVATELRGVEVIRGSAAAGDVADGGGILNFGDLVLVDSTVRDSSATSGDGGGIANGMEASLVLVNTTVSGNAAVNGNGGGIATSMGLVTLTNSTVSGNDAFEGGGIWNDRSDVELAYVTMSGNRAAFVNNIWTSSSSRVRVFGSIVESGCFAAAEMAIVSDGHNIESPGDTCGFDQPTDQVNVARERLKLDRQADNNGGATRTHALSAGSVAIDVIPAEDCVDADGLLLPTDQRGFPRPVGAGCDVGAFEAELEILNPCMGVANLLACEEASVGFCVDESCVPVGCADAEEGAHCARFNAPGFNKDWYFGFCVAGSCEHECTVLDDGDECSSFYYLNRITVCRDGRCALTDCGDADYAPCVEGEDLGRCIAGVCVVE